MIKWEFVEGTLLGFYAPEGVGEGLSDEERKDQVGHGIYRAKIMGGWLVCPAKRTPEPEMFMGVASPSNRPSRGDGLTFVPDPNHSWNP